MVVRDHADALDFDLFDRWRVRLCDVPSTIGWGAVALYLRHMPYGCAVMREIDPATNWSNEAHMLANVIDLIGDLFAEDYKHVQRPGTARQYESAKPVTADEHEEALARFREVANG